MLLSEIKPGMRIAGIKAGMVVVIESVRLIGSEAVQIAFIDAGGLSDKALLYANDLERLIPVAAGRVFGFTGDGQAFKRAAEARRIQLAWLSDPFVAVASSAIEPLPHQISAVYEAMLTRQPLRFLLADDPGAGKTIMAGLLVKELIIRGDMQRCLIVAPGSLIDQWQDELDEKFDLRFELVGRALLDTARGRNPFEQMPLAIARMDQLSRGEDWHAFLNDAPEWDLVIVDEAHRMSGHLVGSEVKYTRRYHLGELLGQRCRNLLLMSATPHNGNEGDFQIFMGLLDGDRFQGGYREGVRTADTSDLMRRLVKEDLLRFDGTRLFPERRSYTSQYALSPEEAHLYSAVTTYVREEMNRAERLADDGQRRVNVGFALMTLQRRLASSPEAIWKSLTRRRNRLESQLREARVALRGSETPSAKVPAAKLPNLREADWDDIYEEAPQDEREAIETEVVDMATAAQTVAELEVEIQVLAELEKLAHQVRLSGRDAKWTEFQRILNDDPEMRDLETGQRRKLVLFTEFRDTLSYLADKIRGLLGRSEAVVEIHGGVVREQRRDIVAKFMNDPTVLVLVANDAAGEGVNLQRAHLMVNYDLPWNPNRLEQRFGRIHRIGQTEVCHLWNLVAKDTREGDVYHRLLIKLEEERKALGGKVFDVLGALFEGTPLRDLLMNAIRYGNDPKTKAKLFEKVDKEVNRDHLESLISKRALVASVMDAATVQRIRSEMDQALIRKLQPHYVEGCFLESFRHLGGSVHRREKGRWEITMVPAAIREIDRHTGKGDPVQRRYERICFDKGFRAQPTRAELVGPGHPLLEATLKVVLDREGGVLRQGSILIHEQDWSTVPRLLFLLEHSVTDGVVTRHGRRVISKRVLALSAKSDGTFAMAGPAPWLDMRAADEGERALFEKLLDESWLTADWEARARDFAVVTVAQAHLNEVRERRLAEIDKVHDQVRQRLVDEISFWDKRARELREQERAGKAVRLPASEAERRCEDLTSRLQKREAELDAERMISADVPGVVAGALVVPRGLLETLKGAPPIDVARRQEAIERIEAVSMAAVIEAERALGREPVRVDHVDGLGYDIQSKLPDGGFVFVEVKGLAPDTEEVVLTASEIKAASNYPERWRLALVSVDGGQATAHAYVSDFDFGQPGEGQVNARFRRSTLESHAKTPH